MKLMVVFDLDSSWDDYRDTDSQLTVDDLLDNWPGKDGVTISSVQVIDEPQPTRISTESMSGEDWKLKSCRFCLNKQGCPMYEEDGATLQAYKCLKYQSIYDQRSVYSYNEKKV